MFSQIAWAVASDAIEAVCMPPIAIAAASDTIRPVAVKIRIHHLHAQDDVWLQNFYDETFVGLRVRLLDWVVSSKRLLDRDPSPTEF